MGQALGRALQGLPRDRIILATKVGRYGGGRFDFSAETVTASVHESLQRLQTSYIDLIQTHDIEFTHLDQVPASLRCKAHIISLLEKRKAARESLLRKLQ